ncbi:hypothetical protein ACFWM3_20425 [Gottfriedia sp. NPDC058432]|uniref:hypothetical protein n=1 Tax=Gottfriedia sp. NPDC058432 TaxID=3346497 RepID=UPI00366620E4
MNKMIFVFLLLSSLCIAGCTKEEKPKKNNIPKSTLYFGEGKYWFGTYTISKVDSMYYDSLTIQYINDGMHSKIGNIEYELKTDNQKLESSFPRPLSGYDYFHISTGLNAELIEKGLPKKATLQIQWKDKKETIILKRQN